MSALTGDATPSLEKASRRRRAFLRYVIVLISLVGVAVCGAIVLARVGDHELNSKQPVISEENEHKSDASADERNRVPMGWELITARPGGFEPKEITRPSGPFLLLVDNRSGIPDLILQLDHQAGSRLRAVRVAKHKLDWQEKFDLAPGTYILTEANNPDWSCRITITSR
jgi:hypothetical protein